MRKKPQQDLNSTGDFHLLPSWRDLFNPQVYALLFIVLIGILIPIWPKVEVTAEEVKATVMQELEGKRWSLIVTSIDGDYFGHAIREQSILSLVLARNTDIIFYLSFVVEDQPITFDQGKVKALRGYLSQDAAGDLLMCTDGIFIGDEVLPIGYQSLNLTEAFAEPILSTTLKVASSPSLLATQENSQNCA